VKRPFRAPRANPKQLEVAQALGRDSEVMLLVAQSELEESGNPYYAWFAVEICIKAKEPFPDWLTAYLAGCAHRMLSKKAKDARDLRKILPWVLGFPSRRGPGNPLEVNQNQHKKAFALEFAIRMDTGDEPAAARLNACNAVFEGKYANADDRTLQRWLLEVFGLKKAPSNVKEWKKVTDKYYQPLLWAFGIWSDG
jgi:hypothetical protein